MIFPNIVVTTGTDADLEGFEKVSDQIWRTQFWDVGEGYSIRAIAHAPKDGRAEVTYEWAPHEPTVADQHRPDREVVEMFFRLMEAYLYVFYRNVHGFTAQAVGQYS